MVRQKTKKQNYIPKKWWSIRICSFYIIDMAKEQKKNNVRCSQYSLTFYFYIRFTCVWFKYKCLCVKSIGITPQVTQTRSPFILLRRNCGLIVYFIWNKMLTSSFVNFILFHSFLFFLLFLHYVQKLMIVLIYPPMFNVVLKILFSLLLF